MLRQPYRRTAIVVGVLLIVCLVASVLSVAPLGSMLDSPVDLTRLAANDDRVVLTALIEFVAAASGARIAIALYPVLRHYGRAVAFGPRPHGSPRECWFWWAHSASWRSSPWPRSP